MARFIPDPISSLPWRPFKREDEIDAECENLIRQCLDLSPESPIPLPITTDLLTVIIEEHVERLDLYADMAPEVHGLTIISATNRSFVRINRQLSTASYRINRLRSTMAHEFYHLVFHAPYYQEKSKQSDLFQRVEEQIVCTRHTVLNPKKVDWREWQAAYGAGALLMPITELQRVMRKHSNLHGFPPYTGGTREARTIITIAASCFEVSQEAAEVRLWQKGFLHQEADGQQLRLLGR